MSTFYNAARRVHDDSRPLGQRFRAFLWALESYAFLTRQRFHVVYNGLGAAHGFSWRYRPSEAQLLAALAEVDRAREEYLAGFRVFAARRREEKARGRRQPTRVDLARWYPVLSPHYAAEVQPALPAGLQFEDRYSEQYLEGTPSGQYHFRVNLRGDAEALAGVHSVVHRLPAHPTPPPSPVTAVVAQGFLLDGLITREEPFSVIVEVRWADGRTSTHTIALRVR